MRSIEPVQISHQDVLSWFVSAWKLIARRKAAFATVSILFPVIIALATKAIASIADFTPAVVAVSSFILFASFVFACLLAVTIMVAHQSDQSRPLELGRQLATLAPAQKDLLKMALLVFFVGAFYWITYITVFSGSNLLEYCQRILSGFEVVSVLPLALAVQVTAGLLYFALLVLISMRLFFSLQLMFFHDLDYDQARELGQRGLLINIQPVTTMMISWIVILGVSLKLVPWLSLVLMPLLGAYAYVAYRHVFLGQQNNAAERPIVSTKAAPVSVTH